MHLVRFADALGGRWSMSCSTFTVEFGILTAYRDGRLIHYGSATDIYVEPLDSVRR